MYRDVERYSKVIASLIHDALIHKNIIDNTYTHTQVDQYKSMQIVSLSVPVEVNRSSRTSENLNFRILNFEFSTQSVYVDL